MSRHRILLIVKVCVAFLIPPALYSLAVPIYLLATHKLDAMTKSNSILLLTTSVLSLLFLFCWSFARSNGPIRPPSTGKKVTFLFSLLSTTFWLASLWTGGAVAVEQLTCRPGAAKDAMLWSAGMTCRLHRVGVAFSAVGLLSSLMILSLMVEISDRPFGGVSTEATISWTAEKFREALLDLTTQENGANFAKELLQADRGKTPRSSHTPRSRTPLSITQEWNGGGPGTGGE
ncbi:uncharacterized protein LAJ45_04770 [Morchella importuna]|uniref:MARVEL domain-containing protein n=1 Tax=Morchella conica CCBAS932 TaxID=1392247 RepID=A0A3N4KF58_9PEZI|nr:uncharacterized protein LAJ45_04770 [Morchella importuna]KAH8151068.1 hypothetical protein LAJ45_04770 [Morchella importuna]RPB09163.1 hypothetical protein P167DRAFT_577471 [Morchella conica CCBAS932]